MQTSQFFTRKLRGPFSLLSFPISMGVGIPTVEKLRFVFRLVLCAVGSGSM